MNVVLLPGTLCDERVFAGIVNHLSQPRILDYRGFDRVERAAEALLADVSPRSLGVAFSLGSWVLLDMLKRDPERFCGVALLAGNAFPDAPENAVARRAEVQKSRSEGFAPLAQASWLRAAGSRAPDREAAVALLLSMAQASGHDVHARQAEMNIHRPDLREVVARSPVPVLVVAGADDPLCPIERYVQAASAPLGRLITLPGTGHYVPIEAPSAVLTAILGRFPEARA